ncbi:hypothetical protein [Enemella evansiae]|uniref:hypothetical protein n=1 Tax=Enemella evansiae TaxID=2016499 RepID=UPI0011814BF4|nr:hypothetical protein [Enemella evansiae]
MVAVVLRGRLPVAATELATVSTITARTMGVTADPCAMVGLCLFAVAERRGSRLLTSYPGMGLLEPVTGGLVMAAWTLVITLAAAAVFLRRDTNG